MIPAQPNRSFRLAGAAALAVAAALAGPAPAQASQVEGVFALESGASAPKRSALPALVRDYFAELLEDAGVPKVVERWAAQALADYFLVRPLMAAFDKLVAKPDPKLIKKKQRDVARVQALIDLIERKRPENVTPDAERFLRRNAIRALASAQIPAVVMLKPGKIEGPAAWGLLHVLAKPGRQGWTDDVRFTAVAGKNTLDPPPSLSERIDAAVGVCQLKFDVSVDPLGLYNADVGIYLVGRLTADFVDAYRADFAKKYHVGRKAWSEPPALPWKTEAHRLKKALAGMQENANRHPARKRVTLLIRFVRPALDNISKNERILEAVDRAQLADLRPEQTEVFLFPKTVKAPKGPNFVD